MNEYNSVVFEDSRQIINSVIPWKKLKDRTVLITGANGAVASYLVYTLLALNDECNFNIKVIGIVRSIDRAKTRFGETLDRDDFSLIVQDVCLTIEINEPIDYIIHAASNTTPTAFLLHPVETLHANYIGTDQLLKLALQKKCTAILFVSSDSVYGYDTSDKFRSEIDFSGTDSMTVKSCYVESKRSGEAICSAYYSQYDVPVSSARLSSIVAPGIYLDKKSHLAEFVEAVKKNENIVLHSTGQSLRTYVPICDAVQGIFLVLLSGKRGIAYNVAHERCVKSIYEMAEMIISESGNTSIKIDVQTNKADAKIISEQRNFCTSGTLLEMLGWNPILDISHAVRQMLKGTSL